MRQYCADCGRTYNDEWDWTICPHNPLEAGPDAADYCRKHDFFTPCPVCHPPAPPKEQMVLFAEPDPPPDGKE